MFSLVKWQYNPDYAYSWELVENLKSAQELLQKFQLTFPSIPNSCEYYKPRRNWYSSPRRNTEDSLVHSQQCFMAMSIITIGNNVLIDCGELFFGSQVNANVLRYQRYICSSC